jgi:hypothetical protein
MYTGAMIRLRFFGSLLLLPVLAILPVARAQNASNVDTAFQRFWSAKSPQEAAQRADDIVKSGVTYVRPRICGFRAGPRPWMISCAPIVNRRKSAGFQPSATAGFSTRRRLATCHQDPCFCRYILRSSIKLYNAR